MIVGCGLLAVEPQICVVIGHIMPYRTCAVGAHACNTTSLVKHNKSSVLWLHRSSTFLLQDHHLDWYYASCGKSNNDTHPQFCHTWVGTLGIRSGGLAWKYGAEGGWCCSEGRWHGFCRMCLGRRMELEKWGPNGTNLLMLEIEMGRTNRLGIHTYYPLVI